MLKINDHIWVRLAQDPNNRYRGRLLGIFRPNGMPLEQVIERCDVHAAVEFHADNYRVLRLGPGGVAAGFDEIELRTTNV